MKTGAIVYVYDAQQANKDECCTDIKNIVSAAHKVNDKINYNVFIHKVDNDMFNTEDQKNEVFNEF